MNAQLGFGFDFDCTLKEWHMRSIDRLCSLTSLRDTQTKFNEPVNQSTHDGIVECENIIAFIESRIGKPAVGG